MDTDRSSANLTLLLNFWDYLVPVQTQAWIDTTFACFRERDGAANAPHELISEDLISRRSLRKYARSVALP